MRRAKTLLEREINQIKRQTEGEWIELWEKIEDDAIFFPDKNVKKKKKIPLNFIFFHSECD